MVQDNFCALEVPGWKAYWVLVQWMNINTNKDTLWWNFKLLGQIDLSSFQRGKTCHIQRKKNQSALDISVVALETKWKMEHHFQSFERK